jgi:hypothetical protein
MHELRRMLPGEPSLQLDTLRLRLLRVAARVQVTARRVWGAAQPRLCLAPSVVSNRGLLVTASWASGDVIEQPETAVGATSAGQCITWRFEGVNDLPQSALQLGHPGHQ